MPSRKNLPKLGNPCLFCSGEDNFAWVVFAHRAIIAQKMYSLLGKNCLLVGC